MSRVFREEKELEDSTSSSRMKAQSRTNNILRPVLVDCIVEKGMAKMAMCFQWNLAKPWAFILLPGLVWCCLCSMLPSKNAKKAIHVALDDIIIIRKRSVARTYIQHHNQLQYCITVKYCNFFISTLLQKKWPSSVYVRIPSDHASVFNWISLLTKKFDFWWIIIRKWDYFSITYRTRDYMKDEINQQIPYRNQIADASLKCIGRDADSKRKARKVYFLPDDSCWKQPSNGNVWQVRLIWWLLSRDPTRELTCETNRFRHESPIVLLWKQ